jgi:Mlc titration factor MtfA (ptsG expression regulator)
MVGPAIGLEVPIDMNPQVEAVVIVLTLIAGFLVIAFFLMPWLGRLWSPGFFAWLEPRVFWIDDRRRRRILSQPFPSQWNQYLRKNVSHYQLLSDGEQTKLRNLVQIFVAEKHWEGCRGLQVTDEMKVTIAGQACLLVLGMTNNFFPRVKTILIYPGGFRVPRDPQMADFSVEGATIPVLGQAVHRGPVILSWEDIVNPKSKDDAPMNLVIHEFAHQLDMQGGPADGMPFLSSRKLQKKWRRVMKQEYDRLVEQSEEGRVTLLDEYGAASEVEFFAVASECFFELPLEMKRQHPQLYDVLARYYRQDPAARWLQHSSY